jgi:ubiquinone/menaquinone biosynthesis C-methylase UbiE
MTETDYAQTPTLRPDAARRLSRRQDCRSPARLIAHYSLELRLARRLRDAPSNQRAKVYAEVYEELFKSNLLRPSESPESRRDYFDRQINRIPHHISPESTFLEIGGGDATMSFRVAERVRAVYDLDITDARIDFDKAPANFTFLRTDGLAIALDNDSVDIVFSDQLMEHLHPDDAQSQLKEIYRVLKPGGGYWVTTPSRITGPHDISQYFDYEARGFHLREYDYRSLKKLLIESGFKSVAYYLCKGAYAVRVPTFLLIGLETIASALPLRLRSRLTNNQFASGLFGIHAFATK